MNLESITLSKSEKLFIKRNLGFPWIILLLFIVLIALGAVFYYLNFVWGEIQVLSVFSEFEPPCPGIDQYIKDLFVKISYISLKPALCFFSISIGMCTGSLFGHFSRAKIFKKLQIDKYL
jgi:hypothetical protein